MKETSNLNLVSIVDGIGRTILGEKLNSTLLSLELGNPAILYVTSDEENKGRLSVQMVPLFFREFLGNKDSKVKAVYKDSQYTMLDVGEFDPRMVAQYQQTFARAIPNQAPASTTPQTEEPKIVNLFDESK